MKRYSGLQFLFGFFVVLSMMLVKPFDVYAITPLSSITMQTFEDGPWAGQSVALGKVNSNGTFSNYGVPSWREGNSTGSAYYNSVGSYSSGVDGYVFSNPSVERGSVDNIVIWSYGPLDELYVVDSTGAIVADVLEDAFLCNPSSSRYFYGVSCHAGAGVAFSSSAMVYLTELSVAFNGGSYYEQIMDSLPYLGAIYDVNSIAVKYPGIVFANAIPYSLSYGFNYYVFPCIASAEGDANDRLNFYFDTAVAVLNADSNYTVRFEVAGISDIRWTEVLDSSSVVSGNQIVVSGTGRDNTLYDTTFQVVLSESSAFDTFYMRFVQIDSEDIGTIPPDDSGGGEGGSGSPDYSSALSQIGARLDEVMAAVSEGSQQIVNNITYQTTEITNTITNTVTNMTQQITQGLSDVKQGITDKLQGVQEGISSSIEEANKEQIENDQKLHDEQIAADKENTDQIINGYDNSGIIQENEKLEQSINDYDEVESEIFDEAGGFVGEFEYPSIDSLSGSVIKALAFVGSFLQSIFLSMGDFSSIITFSLTMIFVMVVVGYHRIRS